MQYVLNPPFYLDDFINHNKNYNTRIITQHSFNRITIHNKDANILLFYMSATIGTTIEFLKNYPVTG